MFTDWNKTGVDALRITNDRHYYRGGQEQLWRIDSERDPKLYTSADGCFGHLGLGVAERVTLHVQWPDGQWGPPLKLLANHHALVERDKDTVSQWFPEASQPHSTQHRIESTCTWV